MQEQAAEATIAAIGKNVGLAGSGSAIVLAGLDINVLAAIAGVVVGVLGLAVQVYFKLKTNRREAESERREAEYHAARMEELRERDT